MYIQFPGGVRVKNTYLQFKYLIKTSTNLVACADVWSTVKFKKLRKFHTLSVKYLLTSTIYN